MYFTPRLIECQAFFSRDCAGGAPVVYSAYDKEGGIMKTMVRSVWFPVGLMVLGAGLVALGVWRGEAAVVLRKAIRICLECIGIG